jgi:hypothetical protein
VSRYDEADLTATFTYKEWCLIHDALKDRRETLHRRADFLETTEFSDVAAQINGTRRKASAIYEGMQKVDGGLAEVRQNHAIARDGRTA